MALNVWTFAIGLKAASITSKSGECRNSGGSNIRSVRSSHFIVYIKLDRSPLLRKSINS